MSECDLIESVQYESVRVVTGAMRGTSRSRLSDELAWEDMNMRRSMHKLVLYYKIVNNLTPSFLSDLLPQTVQQRSGLFLRNSANFTLYMSRTERFKKSFFPSATLMWKILSLEIEIYPLLKFLNARYANILIFKHIISYMILQLIGFLQSCILICVWDAVV